MSLRASKNEKGQFNKYSIEGHLYYPSLNRPNTRFKKEGIYETYLCPTDKKEITEAKGQKVKVKEWEDAGIPECIYFKQYTKSKSGGENNRPPVLTEDGQPFKFQDNGRDVIIGNGTRAKIEFYIYTIKNDYGVFTNYMISRVKILDLVEYDPDKKDDPTESNEENLDF